MTSGAKPAARELLRWARDGVLAGAGGGFAFALLHQVFVAFAPPAFLSILPGAVFGLAFAPAYAHACLHDSAARGALRFGGGVWLALVPFFGVVVSSMEGRVWADGPLPAARPYLTLAPIASGAVVGALLTRSVRGALLTSGAVWLVTAAIGAFLLVETRPAVYAAMLILLPATVTASYVMARSRRSRVSAPGAAGAEGPAGAFENGDAGGNAPPQDA